MRHGAAVRALVPSSNLLVYRVGEGWDRLCHFLELQIPHSPFPHENKAGQAGNIVDKVHKMDVFNRAEREVTRSLITISLAVTATVLGGIFARKYLWSDSIVLITYKSRLEVIVQLTLVSDNTQLPSCRVLRIH